MAIDIMKLAQGMLGDGAMGQMASMLGEGEQQTKKAFDVAGASILGGLMKQMSSPAGAQSVMRAVGEFDTSFLDDATSVLSGRASEEKKSDWSKAGGGIISSLLGGSLETILKLIGQVAGFGKDSSKSMLSMLAPLIMGVIVKQFRSGNMNLGDLTGMIMGQKAHVARAVPAEFQQQLGIANLLKEGTGAVRDAGQQVSRAAQKTAEKGFNWLSALVPLALLVGIGFLAWNFLFNTGEKITPKAIEDGGAVAGAMGDVELPSFSLDGISGGITSAFTGLTDTISGITNEETAREAVSKIEDVEKTFAGYALDQVPADQLTGLSGLLEPLITKIRAALTTVYQIPGVQAIIEPAVESLMGKVTKFS